MTLDLSSLGWDETYAAAAARFTGRDLRPARVTRVEPGVCTVLAADGPHRASLSGSVLADGFADIARLPCVGDWVVVRTWPDRRLTAEVVLPRRSILPGLAANLDAVVLANPKDPGLIAFAAAVGASPLVRSKPMLSYGQTLALVSHARVGQSPLIRRLAGADVLAPPGTLIPVPGGGALVSIHPPPADARPVATATRRAGRGA